MPEVRPTCLVWTLACLALLGAVSAAEPAPPAPLPWQHDAQLNDLQFVGRTGWCVGEHGTIWNTTDGGATWTWQASPVDCSLRSVCALTPRIAFIAGGGTLPQTAVSAGVLLATRDGGATWKSLVVSNLPELFRARFFDPERGLATCRPSPAFPSGLAQTPDGGATWLAAPGDATGVWTAADFPIPEMGGVAGTGGLTALWAGGRLRSPRVGALGSAPLRSLRLSAEGPSWLVGAGGLVLQSENTGVSWQTPATPLAPAVRDLFDFHAVAVQGTHVWLAGSPGSIIFHSPDNGRTWQRQATRQPLPLRTLAFTSATEGWAAGALGTILHTLDGGRTWTVARRGGARAAYLACHRDAGRIAWPVLARLSGEAGYRGVVAVLSERTAAADDAVADGSAAAGTSSGAADLNLDAAIQAGRGSAGVLDWRFPLDAPGLDADAEQLVQVWNRRTEGQLADLLIGGLVAQLRMWRPMVVVIDEAGPEDAAGQLLRDAALKACEQAADATYFPHQLELGQLAPWKTARIFLRLPAGSQGELAIDPFEFLPRSGSSVATAAAQAAAHWSPQVAAAPPRETFRLLRAPDDATRPPNDFFAGLSLTPGSDARRELAPLNDADLEQRQQAVRQQRNFQAYVERTAHDPRQSAQVLAQIREMSQGLTPAEATLQLARLARTYQGQGAWELAEAAQVELVENFPHEPLARDAQRWLVQYWCGYEPAHRRGQSPSTRLRLTTDSAEVRDRAQPRRKKPGEIEQARFEPLQGTAESGVLRTGLSQDFVSASQNMNHDRARRLAKVVARTTPGLAASPAFKFPLASVARLRQEQGEALVQYNDVVIAGGNGPWQQAALAELWLMQPSPVPPRVPHVCRTARERPELDGLLVESCWQEADELLLTAGPGTAVGERRAFVLLSHDDQFLFLGASVPREPDAPADEPVLAGRKHDADLRAYDRLTLVLDVDRDYATFYRFTVDQRGWTAEDCWGDVTWNPGWYVAAAGDADAWRIEIAIPLKELIPAGAERNAYWNIGLTRTLPARRTEHWPAGAPSELHLESGGLLKLE